MSGLSSRLKRLPLSTLIAVLSLISSGGTSHSYGFDIVLHHRPSPLHALVVELLKRPEPAQPGQFKDCCPVAWRDVLFWLPVLKYYPDDILYSCRHFHYAFLF